MLTFIRMARQTLISLTLLYSAGIALVTMLSVLRLYQSWWLTLTNMFALLLFIPLLLLIPAALLVNSTWLRIAVTLVVVAFFALFGSQVVPPATPDPGGTPLRVLTFNHLFTNQRADAIVAAIRSQNADVVALQELSPRVAAALTRDLGTIYPYQYLLPSDTARGIGFLSRYAFQSTAEMQHNIRALQVTITVKQQTVTLIGLHLSAPTYKYSKIGGVPIVTGYDASLPTRQVGQLAEIVDAMHGPLVVMGDFNTSDREPRYDVLAARMHDAFRETGWGFGYSFPDHRRFGPITLPFPLVRIDYVWSKNGVLPAAAHVECDNLGADHCFLVADLWVMES